MADQLILVVEDDAVARGSLSRALFDAGYQTIEAANGQEGLELARERHPDAIICDNLMPILGGLDVLSLLRQDSWGKDVPFILLTSDYDLEGVNESLQAGNSDFLVKDDTSMADITAALARRLG